MWYSISQYLGGILSMKNKKAIMAISTTILTSLVLGMTIYSNLNSPVKSARATDDPIILKVTNQMLASTVLQDYRHPKKTYSGSETDKKFTIDLGNGKYIKGALLFRDCSYQYVGSTLADAFGMNNTSNKKQPLNFNFLFSFENAIRGKIDFGSTANVHETVWKMVRFGYLDGADFYNNLGQYEYAEIVDESETHAHTPFPNYDDTGGGTYYVDDPQSQYVSESHYDEYPPTNLLGFHFYSYAADGFSSGANIAFTITEIEFRYTCL